VIVLLTTLSKLACTVITVPAVAPAEITPAPLPWVNVKSVVLEFIQVTDDVMSCGPLTLGNVASAVNVTELPTAGLIVGTTVRLIVVGVPSETVTVVVAAATVPELALIVVSQTPPETLAAGVTKPDLLMVAQVVVPELHKTFAVKSCCDPSLKVPVAAICMVCGGLTVMVWFCGPISSELSVGLTKNPVQPDASAKTETAAAHSTFRVKFDMMPKPLNEGFFSRPAQLKKL